MLKRFFLAAIFSWLLSPIPAFAAGTIPLSMTQQFDSLGKPLANCSLYIIQAGTTSTPQNAYQDSALTLALPNPMTCDASGRLPQFFLADGSIKIRLTDKNGVTQVVADGILVIGPSSGGGGGSTVDPTTVMQTGHIEMFYGTGVLSGFVRANGRTIGSATSGASERANADTQALFLYLWAADTNLAVSTGRGASAAADWAANKTITLPDWRGRALAGLDDMGNSAAGRLTSTYFGATATVLGAAAGSESTTLTLAQLPTGITSAGSNSITVHPQAGDFVVRQGNNILQNFNPQTASGFRSMDNSASADNTLSFTGTNTISATSNNTSGSAHRTVQPTMLATIYLKL